jgi:hypothetical protein
VFIYRPPPQKSCWGNLSSENSGGPLLKPVKKSLEIGLGRISWPDQTSLMRTRQVQLNLSRSSLKPSGSWSQTRQVWLIGLVRCHHRTGLVGLLSKPASDQTSLVHWTSLVPPLDKSDGALWSPVQTLWKPVDSLDKSDET